MLLILVFQCFPCLTLSELYRSESTAVRCRTFRPAGEKMWVRGLVLLFGRGCESHGE